MKTASQIVDSNDRVEWSLFLTKAEEEGNRRPLMAREYADRWGEHETHQFHLPTNLGGK